MNKFSNLREFVDWFLRQRIGELFPVEIYNYGQAITLVLYREAQFQAELIIVLEGGGFPEEHSHPNVESYEVGFVGKVPFTLNGVPAHPERVICTDRTVPTRFGLSVPANALHGATHVYRNCAFLSLQRWLNNTAPTSVALDWDGSAPISDEHKKELNGHKASNDK